MARKVKQTFNDAAEPEWAKLPLEQRPLNKNGTPMLTSKEYEQKQKALIKKHCRPSLMERILDFGSYEGPSIPLPPISEHAKMSVIHKRKYKR